MQDEQKELSVFFEKSNDNSEDDKLIKMKVYIANVGENYNASYFSKEVLTDMAKNSLSYTPIVGLIGKNQFKEKDFRAHEEELTRIKNSETGEVEYDFRYLGFAYGFVGLNPEWDFETKVCPDGVTREYLVCNNVLIWKKWSDVIDIFERDGWSKKHSMELKDCEGFIDENDKLFHFTSATFDGLCVLGNDVEPGIPFSTIEKASFMRFSSQIKDMVKDYITQFSISLTPLEGGDTRMNKENFLKKEDWGTGDKVETDLSKDAASDDAWSDVDKTALRNDILKASNYKSLVNSAYLIVEDGWEDSPSSHLKYPVCQIKDSKLVYNIIGVEAALQRLHQEGIESGSPIDKLKKIYRKLGLDTSNFTKEEGEHLSKKEIAANFKLTAGQMFDEFNRVLSEVTYKTEDWWSGQLVDSCRFWLRDYDESFVYVVDCQNDYMDMKIPYTTEGDNIKIDYENASRIKYAPTDWQGETEDDPDYDNDVVIETVQEYAKKVIAEAKEKFTSINQEHASQLESIKTEYESKLSEQQDSILSMTKKIEDFTKQQEQFTAKITELEQFKAQKIQEETQAKVDELFKEYSSYLSVEEVESLKERQAEFSSFEVFAKEVKALACDKITAQFKRDGKTAFAFVEKPNESQSDENTTVFDRLKKFTETK